MRRGCRGCAFARQVGIKFPGFCLRFKIIRILFFPLSLCFKTGRIGPDTALATYGFPITSPGATHGPREGRPLRLARPHGPHPSQGSALRLRGL